MSRSLNSGSIKLEHLTEIEPITDNQKLAKGYWEDGDNLVLAGSAGTGKTYLGLGLALESVLDKQYNQVIVVRSIVPTRDIGFLPGDEVEKKKAYTNPYVGLAADLFDDGEAWDKLLMQKKVQFLSTSFIRGTTYDNAVILVDEMQNLTFHELDSVLTRVGENCRIILCGDYYQSDFRKEEERSGLPRILEILEHLNNFSIVEFGWQDIVRSDFVRDYIMTKEMLGIKNA